MSNLEQQAHLLRTSKLCGRIWKNYLQHQLIQFSLCILFATGSEIMLIKLLSTTITSILKNVMSYNNTLKFFKCFSQACSDLRNNFLYERQDLPFIELNTVFCCV